MDTCCGIDTNPMRYIEAHIQMVLSGLACTQHVEGQASRIA